MSKNRQARRASAAKKRRQSERRLPASRQHAPARSRSPEPQAGSLSYDALRWGLGKIAADRGDWAGIPMPLDGARLVIEPSFPNAAGLAEIGAKPAASNDGIDPETGLRMRLRNRWYSRQWRCDIMLIELENGKVVHGKLPAFHHLNHDLQTLWCADAWGIEQEGNAMALLADLISERAMKQYLLTGMFMETSRRSGLKYIFRRLKPTIAFRAGEKSSRILAALCMHPIAYYAESWAGAMCPTDDVIAHLTMMRGDEHMFWKRCNQHPPYRPEAGL